jgi:hypothetical protein
LAKCGKDHFGRLPLGPAWGINPGIVEGKEKGKYPKAREKGSYALSPHKGQAKEKAKRKQERELTEKTAN